MYGTRPVRPAESRQLVERLIARDTEALGELYDQAGSLVFAIALRVARDRGAAENLTQDVFLRVWNRIPSFDVERSSLLNWVLMIARYTAIDFWRSRQASQGRLSISLDAPDCPTVCSDARAYWHSYADAREVQAALSCLDPKHRCLLELAYFDGLSQPEMAHKLEIPLGTVKTRVRSALRQMREHLTYTTITTHPQRMSADQSTPRSTSFESFSGSQ